MGKLQRSLTVPVPEANESLALPELSTPLTQLEEAFARKFVLRGNATNAYIEAFDYTGPRYCARSLAWDLVNRPHVQVRIRQYESAAARATVIDYAALLDRDREIVEGFRYADQVTRHIWQACRYCNGTDHKYQWIDPAEYYEALTRVDEENSIRRVKMQRELPMPSDEGGYGFDPQNDPSIICPKCEGRGNQVTIIADTTRLEGPAKAIVKGVKETKSGIEIVFHDFDASMNRLMRAGGLYGDDAASVAKGAAAGAAAGVAAATMAAAKAADEMTVEQAQRLYLELT